MICRDMGFFNRTVGLDLTSDDGITWSDPKVAYYGLHQYDENEPVLGLAREGHLERSQVLKKDGVPEYLFVGTVGRDRDDLNRVSVEDRLVIKR